MEEGGELATDDPLIGTIVADRFRILEPLGRGGMGRVYRALQLSVSRVVALKLVPPQVPGREERAERFAREARLTAKLRSDHTITVYDFGAIEDGSLFLAMELIEGRTLRDVIEREGRLDPIRAARLLDQIARSLEEAHGAGLIHRDLKPSNVMLEAEGERAKVLDFGIAKMVEQEEPTLTATGIVCGTPHFMSPEQCQGEATAIGPTSDIYALGVMAFQMLTGELPFRESKAYALMMHQVNTPPPPLTAHLPDAPVIRAYQRILDRCLAKRPEDRFASAAEFREALRSELASPAKPLRRRIGTAAGIVGVAAALAIGYSIREPEEPAPVIAAEETSPPVAPPPAIAPPPKPSQARPRAWRGALEAIINLDEHQVAQTIAAIEPKLAECAEKSEENEAALTVVVLPGGRINVKAKRKLEACARPLLTAREFTLTGGAFGSFRYVMRRR